jgi:predicted RNase H-like HicB family nuclease
MPLETSGPLPYLVAMEPGDDTRAWGAMVPDLPGCFSAGDTLDAAVVNTRAAIELHLEALRAEGRSPPVPTSMSLLANDPRHAGRVWAVVVILAQPVGRRTDGPTGTSFGHTAESLGV